MTFTSVSLITITNVDSGEAVFHIATTGDSGSANALAGNILDRFADNLGAVFDYEIAAAPLVHSQTPLNVVLDMVNDACTPEPKTETDPVKAALVKALKRWQRFAHNNRWSDDEYHDYDGTGWITATNEALALAEPDHIDPKPDSFESWCEFLALTYDIGGKGDLTETMDKMERRGVVGPDMLSRLKHHFRLTR